MKISYRDMQREGLGVSPSTAAAAAAGEQLNHKSHNCSTSLFTVPTTRLKHRQSHARGPLEQKFIYANDYTVILTCTCRRMYGMQLFMHSAPVRRSGELSSNLLVSQTYMEKKAKMNSTNVLQFKERLLGSNLI